MLVSSTRVSVMDMLIYKMSRPKGPSEGFGICDFLRKTKIDEDATLVEDEELPSYLIGKCCRACQSTKPFQRGSDSSLSCTDCGVVNQNAEFVALTHTKACSAADDPTTTADEVRETQHMGGVETSSQTVNRHSLDCSASSLSIRAKRRLGVGQADAEVKRRAVQDHRATIKVSQASDRFNRSAQLAIHNFFASNPAHETFQSLVRKTAFNVILRNQQHGDYCNECTCDLHVVDVPAAVFALVLIRVLAEDASVLPSSNVEVGKLDLLRLVDSANSTVRRQGAAMVVSKATQGIRLTLATQDITVPCTGSTPTGVAIAKTESTESLSSKPVFGIRDSVWASYNLARFSSSLRDHTLRSLGSGRLETWVVSVVLPTDLTAAVLLAACAAVRKKNSHVASPVLTSDVVKTQTQLESVSKASKVSSCVVETMKTQVLECLEVEAQEDDEL